jgi:hypothetical protein
VPTVGASDQGRYPASEETVGAVQENQPPSLSAG